MTPLSYASSQPLPDGFLFLLAVACQLFTSVVTSMVVVSILELFTSGGWGVLSGSGGLSCLEITAASMMVIRTIAV